MEVHTYPTRIITNQDYIDRRQGNIAYVKEVLNSVLVVMASQVDMLKDELFSSR